METIMNFNQQRKKCEYIFIYSLISFFGLYLLDYLFFRSNSTLYNISSVLLFIFAFSLCSSIFFWFYFSEIKNTKTPIPLEVVENKPASIEPKNTALYSF